MPKRATSEKFVLVTKLFVKNIKKQMGIYAHNKFHPIILPPNNLNVNNSSAELIIFASNTKDTAKASLEALFLKNLKN